MRKVTKRAISIFLAVLMTLSVLPVTAFAAEEYPLMIYNDGVRVDENGDNPLRIKETEQKQLTVTYNGSETLPDGTSLVWSSPTPYLVYVDQNGVITGRDSSKGTIMRVWVAENIESLWLIGPGIADSIYSWMDENKIDNMDTQGIVDAMELILTPIFGEDFTAGLCESLRNTLDSMNVEIRVALVDAEGNEIAYNSTHVVCDKSDSLTADFIPNGTYITNHEAVPSQVEVGYEMDMTGVTTPMRLEMGVNWFVTEKNLLGLDVATDKATIDENGHIVFNQPGTVKITAKPDTEGLYNKLTALIEQAGGIANAGDTIGRVLKEVFGLSVAAGVIDALVAVINGIVEAGTGDAAQAMKDIVAKVSDWILGVTINDSVTVTIVDQLDVQSYDIYGDLSNMSGYGGIRLLTITNIQPEGAIVLPEDVSWSSSNVNAAAVDSNGVVTSRDDNQSFTITCTVDGIERTINGNTMWTGNFMYPTDMEFSGPSQLTVGETATYNFTVWPLDLMNDATWGDYNNVEVGLMQENGEIFYLEHTGEGTISDGILSIGPTNSDNGFDGGSFQVTAVGGGTTTLYVRTHSDSQRLGTGIENARIVKTMEISVYQPAGSIAIDQGDTLEVETDDEYMIGIIGSGKYNASTQLSATVGPEDATDKSISWSSDNRAVKVDANGLVSIEKQKLPVTATITATSNDNPALTDSITVTFVKAYVHVTGVTLNTSEVTMGGVGSTYKLTASVQPADAQNQNVTWTSDNPDVVTVSENGTLTAVAMGDATVTVTTAEGSYTASCTVKVRADKAALQAAIDRASQVNEEDVDDAYLWAAFEAALDTANQVNNDEYASQQRVDDATKALEEAFNALSVYEPVTTATIVAVNSADEKEGQVIYHTTPWYKTWTSQTVELTVQADGDIASVEWRLANWSVNEPEGNIESTSGNNATIRPTFGVGPRSIWVQAVVTDQYGNDTVTEPVKVRFINWDWQK